MNAGVRIERDRLGAVAVPASALWGIHTERTILNFPISGIQLGTHSHLVRALAYIKKAAALTNMEFGLIPFDVGQAIASACDIVASGEVDDAFRVDVIQGGAGTSTNMNANEEIANLALRPMGHPPGRYNLVDPIAHVNNCQSTNDAYPIAVRLALLSALEELLDRLGQLCDAFADQARMSTSIPKIGHTELHDAVPMTLGQKLGALSVTLDEDQELLRGAALLLTQCSLEAPAAGTGITANPEYLERLVDNLSTVSGISHSRLKS